MWMRGMCASCHSFAGGRYDQAYADFAHQLQGWMETAARVLVPSPQGITVAPGRVAQSVLSGMLGISPHIRAFNTTLADQVEAGGPVHLPGGTALRVAVYIGRDAQLTGPMLTGFTDGSGDRIDTLVGVTFRRLSWASSHRSRRGAPKTTASLPRAGSLRPPLPVRESHRCNYYT